MKYGTAASLILQVLNGTMFAPEFTIHNGWQTVVMWAIIVLLLIPHHYATKIAAIIMLGLFFYIWSFWWEKQNGRRQGFQFFTSEQV
ncbi:hypothetical protein [Sporosarcina sp. ACRSL]|uniref:hypothetical protein n=1 Tax=Sporosarcina sp. ACRSL TaxID=2918215 RepID=UPI001EF52E99|nr:hypothetical protein [Sporosarcina sp. ACRSL]